MLEEIYQIFQESLGINTDSRTIQPQQIFLALKGENFNGNHYAKQAIAAGAIAAIVDEEVDGENIYRVENSLKFLQELAHFHRQQLDIPVIGLTGSNGKTTTKELIATALSPKFKVAFTQGNLNNHIGVPLTLLSIQKSHEMAVIEMGANHPEEIATLTRIAAPTHGYITNFGKAHLEGFGNLEGVIAAKSELYDFLRINKAFAFVNADDAIQIQRTKNIKNLKFGFENPEVDYFFKPLKNSENATIEFRETEINSHLTGHYNAINIAAAVSIALHFGVNLNSIKKAIENYWPQLNRSQIVKKEQLTIIMDSYNANPTSMEVALKNLASKSGKRIAILGDMFELGRHAKSEHQKITDLAESLDLDEIFLLGENFSQIQTQQSKKFKSVNEFKNYLKENPLPPATILVKGSRGMTLEKIKF